MTWWSHFNAAASSILHFGTVQNGATAMRCYDFFFLFLSLSIFLYSLHIELSRFSLSTESLWFSYFLSIFLSICFYIPLVSTFLLFLFLCLSFLLLLFSFSFSFSRAVPTCKRSSSFCFCRVHWRFAAWQRPRTCNGAGLSLTLRWTIKWYEWNMIFLSLNEIKWFDMSNMRICNERSHNSVLKKWEDWRRLRMQNAAECNSLQNKGVDSYHNQCIGKNVLDIVASSDRILGGLNCLPKCAELLTAWFCSGQRQLTQDTSTWLCIFEF